MIDVQLAALQLISAAIYESVLIVARLCVMDADACTIGIVYANAAGGKGRHVDKMPTPREVSPGLFCLSGGILFDAVGRKWRFKSRNPNKRVKQDLNRPRRSMSRREKTENHWTRIDRLRAYRPGFHYSQEKWRWVKD